MQLARWFAVVAFVFLLLRSIVLVWFTSQVITTAPNVEIAAPPLTDRVVLVVIDGLRYDTALESDLMPRLQAVARTGAAGLSMASLVTMTGLGVRTLGTSSSPALADILLETKLPPVAFDNVFASLRRRGGHIAWLGNSAWRELFGAWIDLDAKIDAELEMMSRVNNIWAADRVIVRRALRLMERPDWQLFVVHLGGLDNASHRFTPFGEEFRAKARSVDDDLARLVAAAPPRTTFVITSDHGTSDRGHHGSGEAITRRTPLVLAGAAIVPGRRLDAQQTDVAPTIAALLGLPIPAPAEGEVLVDALAIPAGTAASLRAANLAQQRRYADAYASERGLEAPALDDPRRLGQWIEEARTRSAWVPVAWALGLALAALALLRPARPRRWWPLLVLAALELAIVGWKLNHRYLEMKLNDVYDATHLGEASFRCVATLLAAAAATWAVRRWWPATRWDAIVVLLGASVLADSFAIPAALVLGIAVVGARPAVAAVLGCFAIAAVDTHVLAMIPTGVVAPVALAALGAWLGPTRWRGRGALLVAGVAASLVRLADNPSLSYRATLIAITLGALVLAQIDRDDRPIALLGWAGAIALAMLSRDAQAPGLVAWTAFAGLAGRGLRDDDRAVLIATLVALAFRFACFGLFEGAFEFSRLEVWLAYEGNPGAHVAFGAAIIATKLALPLAVGLALVTANLGPATRRTVITWTAAFFCLRIAHIAIGMTLARGTFYSPYLDSGQLAFTYLMLLSCPIVVALFAAAGTLTRPRSSA